MGRFLFLIVVLGVLGGIVFASAARVSLNSEVAGRPPSGATPVAVERVTEQVFSETVEALGTARANESLTVTSKVTDVISNISFDSGDLVEAGAVLAELADAEEAADLSEARATLSEAQREFERFEELRARGVASSQRTDELQSTAERARARVRSIEARLADRIVRAPFAGVIGLRYASPGMLVRPGDVIATLDDVSLIKLDFTVPEVFLGVIATGDPLVARSDAYSGRVFEGVISQIDSRVDPVTRTATVRAEITNDDKALRSGMLLLVEVKRDQRTSPSAPEVAVMREGDAAYVYVVVSGPEGDVVERRQVETGTRRDGRLEITDGLSAGEVIVSEGVHRLRPGAPVEVVEGAESAIAQQEGRAS